MGKYLFFFFVIITGLSFSYIVGYSGFVFVYTDSYEIKVSLKCIFFLTVLLLLFIIFAMQLLSLLGRTNLLKYDRKINKIKHKYENYISSVEIAYYELLNKNFSAVNKYIEKAKSFLPTKQLTRLIEIETAVVLKDYSRSLNLLRTINDKKTYLLDSILLQEYIKQNNVSLIQKTAERILLNNKDDQLAITSLYEIYRNNSNWIKCKELLKIIKDKSYFTKDKLKVETQLIDLNIKSIANKKNVLSNSLEKIKDLFRFKKMSA